ncbi:MAG: PolC-type DNA polymerase III [Clostridia bacterium]|nr:PolC-type DNA polymerase III [Clostridia bacterium]
MEKVSFFQVFGELGLSEEENAALRGACVEHIDINSTARVMKLTLAFSDCCPPELISRLSEKLAEAYRLNRADISVHCPKCEFGEAEAQEILHLAAGEYPGIFGFLGGCGITLKENTMEIAGASGGADIIAASGCLRFMEKKIAECYGREIRVVLRPETEEDKTRVSEFLRRRDEEIRRLSEATVTHASAPSKTQPAEQKREFVRKKRPPAPKVDEADIILGKPFGDELTNIRDIDFNGGWYAVEGDVFGCETREVAGGRMTVISFCIYDGTSSLTCKRILDTEKAQPLIDSVKNGMYVAVRGEIQYDNFEKDSVLKPADIIKKKKSVRMDTSEEKRVELHLHTKMSAMDGVVSASDVVKTASAWEHKAVAVTDHGVLHAFPDMLHAAHGKDIKILYGCEGYYVNNADAMPAVFGRAEEPLSGDFVCFDLETTGLRPGEDAIIEIAASLLRDGRIIDTFQTYVNPRRAIPPRITELTGINAGMVADAPEIGAALKSFFDFCRGRVLAAHNAAFDMGFLREAAAKAGLPCEYTYVDSLAMARVMLPHMARHRLNNLAKELNLPKFKHHSGGDDARTLALALAELFRRLQTEDGVKTLSEVNGILADRADKNAEAGSDTQSLPVYHILLLAKDEEGVRALNRMVSYGHLKYMNARKQPIIPRRVLAQWRDHLIVGSACEAGELFRAMLDGANEERLCEIAGFYDFLEIQPIGNNAFMIREGTAQNEEDLRDFNRRIVALGERLGKPVCATGDVHFLNPEDEAFRRILMAAKGFEDCDQQAPLYFRTTEEMLAEFAYLGEEKAREVVITNTNMIADMCGDVCPFPKEMYPPEIPGSAEELERITRETAARLYGDPLPPEVSTVMEKELNSIIKHGFDVMYMFAQKLIRRSNDNGYMVGSRGSVGSSLVAFFLGITEVNALPPHYRCETCRFTEFHGGEGFGSGFDMEDKNCPNCGTKLYKDGFDIPFETFLGFDGDKAPDIDLNFSNEYQGKAHRHTIEMFGAENVFRAGTIGGIKDKTAFGYVKKYCEEREITMPKAEMTRLALGCTEVKRTTGQHPGGMVVVPRTKEIYDFCAVQHPADDQETDIVITHVDYHSIDANLLKFDILGHKDPTMIKHLEELTGIKMEEIDLNDRATLSLYSSNEALGIEDNDILGEIGTCAVPEFGTKFVKQVLVDTRPSTIDELVRVCGMTHGTDVWLNNAKDIIAAGYAPLSGCICCRDDIMLNLIAWGMPPKMSFQIMEFVRKGKGLKPEWEEAMREHAVPEWYIESCKKIKYMFPKAHAAAYVVNGFRVAWYKLHRPLAFYCAFLSVRADALDAEVMLQGADAIRAKILELREKEDTTGNDEELQKNLEVCYEFCLRGFSFRPVDLYRSKAKDFSMEDEKYLRMPFTAVAGLGETAAESLYAEARIGGFLSVEEVAARCGKVSKTLMDKLRAMGAFGDLPESSQSTLF